MLPLPDDLKQNITFLIEQTGAICDAVAGRKLDAPLALRVELALSEIALIALIAAEGFEEMEDYPSVLMRGEAARRLKTIAFDCLDAQEVSDGDAVKELLFSVRAKTDDVADLVRLPKYRPSAGTELAPAGTFVSAESASGGLSPDTMIPLPAQEDDIEKLKKEVRVLRDILAAMVLERDHLDNVTLRDIEAAYMRELGSLEAEAYRAESDARILKARLERMQADLNRRAVPVPEEIERDLRARYEEYKKTYEEYQRRVAEADSYERQRKKQKTAQADASSGEKASFSGGAPETADPSGEAPAGETEEQELKRLYRKIVKAMHPDLHPDQDAATKDLFKKAIVAYKNFDLKTLREISAMLDGDLSENTENLREELLKEKARLLALIRGIRQEIADVKRRYPYTCREILEDPERLEAEKDRRRKRIEIAKRAAEIYQERITEIEKRWKN